MKMGIIFAAALGLAALVSGQFRTEQAKSPKEVLREFIRMELEGARLTPEGSHRTTHFFVRPSPPPPDKKILVASDGYELHESHESQESAITENSAKLYLSFLHYYGRLDSALRFEVAPKKTPDGGIIREGFTADYHLVLTDKHWKLHSGEREAREVVGPPEWKIEHSPTCCITSLATAIRYVTEMQAKTKDPAIRKNASRTLAKLKSLH